MFKNREDAAVQLARRLRRLKLHNPLILGIPRGGVVTAAVLAQELGAEFDIVLARKLRAPFQSEYAIGAIGEDGETKLDQRAVQLAGADDDYIQKECEHQSREIQRRQALFRTAKAKSAILNRSVILTDDGIATGATMLAAIHVVRVQKPRELIVAVPVGSPDRIEVIREQCDQLVCMLAPEDFEAVGQYYEDFSTVEDDDVVNLLKRSSEPSRPEKDLLAPPTALDF